MKLGGVFAVKRGSGDDAATTKPAHVHDFSLDSAYQGQEGLAKIKKARDEGNPYAMAFVDVRMPPGWDGIETTAHLWEVEPDLQGEPRCIRTVRNAGYMYVPER